MWYYIRRLEHNSYFVNLCGHYSITDRDDDASRWDDPDHKAMWYFVHELNATTNQKWIVVNSIGEVIRESEDARTFEAYLVKTVENMMKSVTVESKTFNEAFNGKKPVPDRVFYSELRINGRLKYMPIAEVGNKYYRYKLCLPAPDMTDDMWRW